MKKGDFITSKLTSDIGFIKNMTTRKYFNGSINGFMGYFYENKPFKTWYTFLITLNSFIITLLFIPTLILPLIMVVITLILFNLEYRNYKKRNMKSKKRYFITWYNGDGVPTQCVETEYDGLSPHQVIKKEDIKISDGYYYIREKCKFALSGEMGGRSVIAVGNNEIPIFIDKDIKKINPDTGLYIFSSYVNIYNNSKVGDYTYEKKYGEIFYDIRLNQNHNQIFYESRSIIKVENKEVIKKAINLTKEKIDFDCYLILKIKVDKANYNRIEKDKIVIKIKKKR